MSARVVPVGYILTDEALKELVTTNREWRRLEVEWELATGEAKQGARLQAHQLQDEITAKLFAAVKSHELPAVTMKRTDAGDWTEHRLPVQYLEDMDGDLALWAGTVPGGGLNPEDRWIADAPLCFRRVEFDRWRQKPTAAPSTPSTVRPMARIIPVAYVLTDEAIDELAGADPHLRRLRGAWERAESEAKEEAFLKLSERQTQITDRLVEVVKSGELTLLALKRMPAGEWQEHGVSAAYRGTLGAEVSLWRGSLRMIDLEPTDEWIRSGALCFRRAEFDDWLAKTIVVRPRGAEEIPTWWTVPESSVWIATRKLSKVESLDSRARTSLFVASELVRGTYEASFELLSGLRTGRLLASGWRRGEQSRGASEVIPQAFWKEPTAFSESETGVEGLRGPGDVMVGLLLESDEVMAKWEAPESLLEGEKIPLGTLIGRLLNESWPTYLLSHSQVVVTGLNDRGERVAVDKDVFQTNSIVERSSHSVRTADGRLHWSAVMVELRRESQAGEHIQGAEAVPTPALLSDSEITALARPVIERIAADGRQLRRQDFEPMLRELTGDRLPTKAADRLWRELARPEWRMSGKRREGELVENWRFYLRAAAKPL
jgi:hypothetical protein